MGERKFYKTTFILEVLSEDVPPEWDNLNDIYYLISQGHCSGKIISDESKEITAKEVAEALIAQGSDPEFFRLTEDGMDLEDKDADD